MLPLPPSAVGDDGGGLLPLLCRVLSGCPLRAAKLQVAHSGNQVLKEATLDSCRSSVVDVVAALCGLVAELDPRRLAELRDPKSPPRCSRSSSALGAHAVCLCCPK
eukprot:gene33413-50721_t